MEYLIEYVGRGLNDSGPMAVTVTHGGRSREVIGPWVGFGISDPHMARFLAQIEMEIEAGVLKVDGTGEPHELDLHPADYGIADDQWRKSCTWQTLNGRDLYCLAVYIADKTIQSVRQLANGMAAYETDLGTCTACRIPDERLSCDGLSHVKMYPHQALGGGKLHHPARIWGAACRLGNSEIENVDGCRPGVNHCWHRVVSMGSHVEASDNGFHLLEAFDFLDSEWRHRHPGQRLFGPTSVAEASQLTQPVESRADFADQVVRLGQLLQGFKVDGSLFSAKAKSGALDRLRQWCEEHAPSGVGPVDELVAVNRLRNSLSHTDPPKVAQALARFSIGYPPSSYDEAWRAVVSHVAKAVRELRQALAEDDLAVESAEHLND